MRTLLAALSFAYLTLISAAAPAVADPAFPPQTGRVVDNAHVLSPQTQADLAAKLKALEETTGDQLVVVTLPSLDGDDIQDYGYKLGRAWGVGQKGKDNGALFIVVPSEHKMRIEVGYGLEPVLTDAMTSVILRDTVRPHFRANDFDGGVLAGTEAILHQLTLDKPAALAEVQKAQAQMLPAPAHVRHRGGISPIFILIILGMLLFGGGRFLPWFFLGSLLGGGFGGGYRGGSDWSSGRNDDNDFTGGGGGFGGGGSSGDW